MASSTRKSTAKTRKNLGKSPVRKKKGETASNPSSAAERALQKAPSNSGKKKGKKKKPPPVITIREDYCKGCGICVAFCPTDTLGFKAGKAFVERPETCIGCDFCELRCPDFAIIVEEKNDGAQK